MEQSPDYRFPDNPDIIYMGTPDFAVPALKSLFKEGYNIRAVVTQPDRPRGRGRNISFSPVKELSLNYELNTLQPENINDPDFIAELEAMKPDLFIVAAFGQILNMNVLAVPKFGAVNIHASLLPKYRGAAPIQWAIMDNEPVTGITLMKMAKGLDKGPILHMEKVSVNEFETTGQLFDRLSSMSGEAVINFLKKSAGKKLVEIPQDDSKSSYAAKITKEMAQIDWNMNASKVSALIRAMDPVPGATTRLGSKKIKLFSPVIIDNETVSQKPGKIFLDDGKFAVETGKGIIRINEIQLPGKKRISTSDFLRGHKIEDNTVLGN